MGTLPGRCGAIPVIILFLLLQGFWGVLPPASRGADFDIPLKELKSPGAKNFDIPLGDLKKGEKKAKKTDTRGRKGKKKGEHAEQAPPREAAGPGEDARKPAPAAGGPATEFTPETQASQRRTPPEKGGTDRSAAATAAPATNGIPIIHDPYSYVVAGKSTVISAVIVSAPEGLRSVCCRFRAAGTGGFARVPMTREEGTGYTYTATLPPISPGVESLRYMLVATDAGGKETLSREFSIPVRATSVVPGWQQEPPRGKIKVWLEDPAKPLDGFSEVTAVKTGPP
ncbi:MAG TPA: hypothetical protein VF795_09950 [Desulfuromonadaceae bacterium]